MSWRFKHYTSGRYTRIGFAIQWERVAWKSWCVTVLIWRTVIRVVWVGH